MFKSAGLSPVWLATLLRKNPPEVIHAHYGIYGSQLRHLARILSADLVGSFYGYDASMDRYVKSRFWKRRYRRLFDECKAIIVEGPAMGERVMALGCPESKLDVIRLPADNESLAGITRTAADTFLVVAPGWATEKKGFDVAVKAFAQALRGRDARLLLLGGGPLVDELRRLAEALKIADQVEWGGSLDFRSFMTRISAGAVAVFPSRQAQDGNSDGGAPVTLIETQWLGVPVLVSNHDDLPFVAAPEGSIVLPPLDVDSWATALVTLYDAPEELERMGAAAAEFVRRWHSISENTRSRERVYERARELPSEEDRTASA